MGTGQYFVIVTIIININSITTTKEEKKWKNKVKSPGCPVLSMTKHCPELELPYVEGTQKKINS